MGLMDTTTTRYEGLKLKGFRDSSAIHELEQAAIERAIEWFMFKPYSPDEIFTEGFIKFLHKKLFGRIWATGGQFRRYDQGIGCPWSNIAIHLRLLNQDAMDWYTQQTYAPTELAVRYAHRLAAICCFENGSGAHARFMADLIVSKLFHALPLTWGSQSAYSAKQLQQAYQAAMEAADCNEFEALIRFSQS